jgi:hypothetical protein
MAQELEGNDKKGYNERNIAEELGLNPEKNRNA